MAQSFNAMNAKFFRNGRKGKAAKELHSILIMPPEWQKYLLIMSALKRVI